MNLLLKLEEIALFGFSIYLFAQTSFAWWWYPLLLLAPDISMLGYVRGPKTGAWVYNFFHHKALGAVLICVGWHFSREWVELSGIILLGHACMDRIAGYGLKYPDDFKHTSLGWLGAGRN
ncbi:uncharacterized protein DUF4260 [Anseongella ginsenosidimutans]|uniref:Uncharacterized protein DUF4260 n=1 Tax=Anseongella ginsenosidimutans TaxID=496056 RepID=A0A4R3KMK9_9SPHI|nr:DUF4260 domain-containing protein [Anseongella ginsenosidimutans]QEC52781.1 DUF4260 family protein [Anseongella ginsenosidimutans]TCS85541.1 uncharacterized protein DUF4260 [Anseongella ginsenosidimutans]